MHTLANYIRQTGAEVMLNIHTYIQRERERERERQTDRKKDRQTERKRQTDRGGERRTEDRQTEGGRGFEERDRQKESESGRDGEGQALNIPTHEHSSTYTLTHAPNTHMHVISLHTQTHMPDIFTHNIHTRTCTTYMHTRQDTHKLKIRTCLHADHLADHLTTIHEPQTTHIHSRSTQIRLLKYIPACNQVTTIRSNPLKVGLDESEIDRLAGGSKFDMAVLSP